jgi:hypothetical protein
MLPKFRLFIVCSYGLFIVHRIVHNHYSSFIVRSYVLFIVHRIIHSHYSLFIIRSYDYSSFIVRSYGLYIIHRIVHSHYSSFIGPFILLFIVTIHRSSDHPNIQLLIHHVVQLTDLPDQYFSHTNSSDYDFPSRKNFPSSHPS